jgi:RNA polymerase sigma factor for flagellar operon FliA
MTTGKSPDHDALIEEGQPLVRSLALKISRSIPVRVDLDDLIAYGQLGLAEAARDFDPGRGGRFTTYAYYRIRGAIYDGVSKMSWTSRARYRRLRYEQMANEALTHAEQEAMATGQGSLEDEARWLRGVSEQLAVVYLASQQDDSSAMRESQLEDPTEPPPVSVASRELSQKLHELVERLPPAERRLIRDVYFEGTTLQEAGDRLNISKSWASRVHAKALDQLAAMLKKMGVSD